MSIEPVIDPKLKVLIALGASVAAGCQPCTEFQVRAAREAGACGQGIHFAVEAALAVRLAATRGIDRWSERCQGARPELDAAFRANKQLLAELIAVASAICVQSVPDLVLHMAEAGRLGATPEMLRATVGIARSVHNAAIEQIEAVLAGDNAVFTSAPNGETPCGPAQGCGCR
ncbi:carboxymuconolactone decarboxylase family protein [Paludibaculum fermentans]|uniref:carboxymuconolactone decarboxylase family protein n=1 Tax=Paludibaculum fermentans TaxID=1473598 RepID=UPI003EB73067